MSVSTSVFSLLKKRRKTGRQEIKLAARLLEKAESIGAMIKKSIIKIVTLSMEALQTCEWYLGSLIGAVKRTVGVVAQDVTGVAGDYE
jgi:hypothetical protein